MSPCSPSDVAINVPDGPSGPAIPPFGTPFTLKVPNMNPFPDGFPEDLLDLLDKLQLLIPPGALKAPLNPNFGKDVFDAIMKLLDQFMPFLMLYKFFLPILELIICIIEVLCALMNPFKLIRAIKRLFTRCIPAFLNLFPIFALIIMIISLLLLILALIEYIISQILKLINAILRNINALIKAFAYGDENSVLAIAKKLGSLLCMFQNLFVLFAIFNIIIQVIRDILSLLFHIPPCDDGDNSDNDGCCTSDVCPAIVKQNYTRFSGIFKYLPEAAVQTSVILPPAFGGSLNSAVRPESWQLFDNLQEQAQQFRNIFDAFDVTFLPKPIFFPTDAVYNTYTDPRQAPYVFDLRLFYNPASWGRPGNARFIRFKNIVMTAVPTTNLQEGDLSVTQIFNGVSILAGGRGYEDDGTTILTGFGADGVTPTGDQARLENFFHMASQVSTNPILSFNDGYTFFNAEYTFKPNISPLLTKNIVTLGCVPDVALSKAFINNVFAGDMALKAQLLGNHINSPGFPDPGAAQECLTAAVATLRSNLTVQGVADFQATTDACLKKLKDDVNASLGTMVGIGFDPCKSSFGIEPKAQFTSKPILVSVNINERNGLPLTSGLSTDVATNIAARITANASFGTVTNFAYDGYQVFTANITSEKPGNGTILISFDNNTFCTNTFPDTGDGVPVHTLQSFDYQFVFTPVAGGIIPVPGTGEGDTSQGTQPRRDEGDQSRDSGNSGGD
jgi:hypothetical protein